jgi:hypothetical protein
LQGEKDNFPGIFCPGRQIKTAAQTGRQRIILANYTIAAVMMAIL